MTEHDGSCEMVKALSSRIEQMDTTLNTLREKNAGYLGEKRVFIYIIIFLQLIITVGVIGIGIKTMNLSEEMITIKKMTQFNQGILKGDYTYLRGGDATNK